MDKRMESLELFKNLLPKKGMLGNDVSKVLKQPAHAPIRSVLTLVFQASTSNTLSAVSAPMAISVSSR